jgi:hypothetical protein
MRPRLGLEREDLVVKVWRTQLVSGCVAKKLILFGVDRWFRCKESEEKKYVSACDRGGARSRARRRERTYRLS